MPAAPAVISLATRARLFPEALARLRQSLDRAGFSGEIFCWSPGNFPAGCPSHEEVPFAFKPFCFREAEARGAGVVLWLDSACVVVRDLAPIFAAIEERGYVLFRNRDYLLGEWASDEALHLLGLERDAAMRISEVNAAAIGLNLRHPVGREFLERWHALAADGVVFRGTREPLPTERDRQDVKWNRGSRVSRDPRVRGHRHDQTAAGILAHRLGMHLSPSGVGSYSSRNRRIGRRTVIVIDRDAARSGGSLRTVDQVRRDKLVGVLIRWARFEWRSWRSWAAVAVIAGVAAVAFLAR
jgi:hypothetical protein